MVTGLSEMILITSTYLHCFQMIILYYMALFLSICIDIYLILFKFSVLMVKFGTMVNKCILICLFSITICIFDLCFWLTLYPEYFSAPHGVTECMTLMNRYKTGTFSSGVVYVVVCKFHSHSMFEVVTCIISVAGCFLVPLLFCDPSKKFGHDGIDATCWRSCQGYRSAQALTVVQSWGRRLAEYCYVQKCCCLHGMWLLSLSLSQCSVAYFM
jgi:hypothetical protein